MTASPAGDLQRLRLPELLTQAAQGEAERNQVALELLRRDEERGKGLSTDVSEAERLAIALARLDTARPSCFADRTEAAC